MLKRIIQDFNVSFFIIKNFKLVYYYCSTFFLRIIVKQFQVFYLFFWGSTFGESSKPINASEKSCFPLQPFMNTNKQDKMVILKEKAEKTHFWKNLAFDTKKWFHGDLILPFQKQHFNSFIFWIKLHQIASGLDFKCQMEWKRESRKES